MKLVFSSTASTGRVVRTASPNAGRDRAAIEEAGFDLIGVADHLWQHPIMGGPEADVPECYTVLALLAASTSQSSSRRS